MHAPPTGHIVSFSDSLAAAAKTVQPGSKIAVKIEVGYFSTEIEVKRIDGVPVATVEGRKFSLSNSLNGARCIMHAYAVLTRRNADIFDEAANYDDEESDGVKASALIGLSALSFLP